MRASRQARARPRPSFRTRSANDSNVLTGITGRLAPNARPCATATADSDAGEGAGADTGGDAIEHGQRDLRFGHALRSTMDKDLARIALTRLHRALDEIAIHPERNRADLGGRVERQHTHYWTCALRDAICRVRMRPARNSAAAALSVTIGTGRHRFQKYAPVGFGFDARIAQHNDAEVVEIANQSADALLQCQHGLRQLIFEKRIAAAAANSLQTSLEQRVIGGREGQLVDGHNGKRIALHIDALPKAARGQQHRVAEFAETAQAALRAVLRLAPTPETADPETGSSTPGRLPPVRDNWCRAGTPDRRRPRLAARKLR